MDFRFEKESEQSQIMKDESAESKTLYYYRDKKLKWSLNDLALKIGVDPKTIDNWEKNSSSPSKERLIQLIEIFFKAGAFTFDKEEKEAKEIWETIQNSSVKTIPDLDLNWFRKLTGKFPNNLPEPTTGFIGRKTDMHKVKQGLEKKRLVTLTGTGGVGKTQLALKVSWDLLGNFEDGVWLVELESLSSDANEAAIVEAIARVLNVAKNKEYPLLDTLIDSLRHQKMLIVLDNCEHLIETCAKVVTQLLEKCHRLFILATSRERLNIQKEKEHRIEPLSIPDPAQALPFEELIKHEAVQLFIEQSELSDLNQEDTNYLAKICYQLDGIPLALKLAAVQTNELDLRTLAERIHEILFRAEGFRDSHPRHYTLYALIDWSYTQLTEEESILLQRLSIFRGNWGLETTEAICTDDRSVGKIGNSPIIHLISKLARKSLVVKDEHVKTKGYRLLETIREYAQEKLETSNTIESLQDKHCSYYLKMAEEFNAEDPNSLLYQEYDNLRTAINWSLKQANKSQKFEIPLRFGSVLEDLWTGHSYLSDGYIWLDGVRRWLDAALLNPSLPVESNLSDEVYAKILKIAGTLSNMRGDPQSAKQFYSEGLSIMKKLDNKLGIARMLSNLGIVEREQGNFEAAFPFYEESLNILKVLDSQNLLEESGNKKFLAIAWNNIGLVDYDRGDFTRASIHVEESLKILRELDNKILIIRMLNSLGDIAIAKSNYIKAHEILKENLGLIKKLGIRDEQTAFVLEYFAGLAAMENQPERAICLAGAANNIRERYAVPLSKADDTVLERRLELAKQHLSKREQKAAWEKGDKMTLTEAIKYASELENSNP